MQQGASFAAMDFLSFRGWAGLLLAISVAIGGPVAAAEDTAAISATVFDYFDGINEVSRERLERAFDPAAALKSVGPSGALLVEPIGEAIDRWMRGKASSRTGTILAIDIDPDGQVARVVFDYDGAYTDYLSLAKLGGQWKIIDKVYVQQ